MRGCSGGGDVHGCSGGECMVAPGGDAWLLWGACVVVLGGMCGCSGGGGVHGCSGGVRGCSVGHAWLLQGRGVCMVAPEGHVWLLRGGVWLLWGACMVALGGACMVALGGHAWFFQGGCAYDTTRYGQ